MRVGFYFTAQAHDQHIDCAVEHLGTFAVRQLEQLFPAEHPPGVLGERQQQTIFSLGQRYRVTLRMLSSQRGGIQRPVH